MKLIKFNGWYVGIDKQNWNVGFDITPFENGYYIKATILLFCLIIRVRR